MRMTQCLCLAAYLITTASELPALQYGKSRASTGWVTTPGGTRVGIDQGIDWKGHSYYMSLTWDLVATATGSDQAKWAQSISAFWNHIGIEMLDKDGKQVECLALRSARHADQVEYRDLTTGKKIGGTAAAEPGKKLALAQTWKGNEGSFDKKHSALIRDAKTWRATHAKLFQGIESAPPATVDVDFSTHSIVVLFGGKTVNCDGYSATAYEVDDKTTVLRITRHTYQSMGYTPPRWPYGVFVVPTEVGDTVRVERNAQNLIGGPEIWKKWELWKVE